MSSSALNWARSLRGPKATQRLVLFVLADHASGEDAESWPGVELIAWEANVTKDTAKDALAALIAAGYVEREQNVAPRRKGVTRGPLRNLYRLAIDGTERQDEDGQWGVILTPQPAGSMGGDPPVNGGRSTRSMGGDPPPFSDATPITGTEVEPVLEPAPSSAPPLPLSTDLVMTDPEPTPGQIAAGIKTRYWQWATATYGRPPDVNPIGLQQILTAFLRQGIDEARLRAAVKAIHEDGAPMTRAVIGAELDGRRRRNPSHARPGRSRVAETAARLAFDADGNLVSPTVGG